MSEFICHIHYQDGYRIGKLDGRSTNSREETFRMEAYVFDTKQVIAIDSDYIVEEAGTKARELEAIYIVM